MDDIKFWADLVTRVVNERLENQQRLGFARCAFHGQTCLDVDMVLVLQPCPVLHECGVTLCLLWCHLAGSMIEAKRVCRASDRESVESCVPMEELIATATALATSGFWTHSARSVL